MSQLIQEFPGETLEEWERWYLERYPDAIENATERIWHMVGNIKSAIGQIDREMVSRWVQDLVIVKTFVGLLFQEAILKELALLRSTDYRLATPDEESKGIDGLVGGRAISIKPDSYKSEAALAEQIGCEIVYYRKTKRGIVIEIES
jgi:hypothetical protein